MIITLDFSEIRDILCDAVDARTDYKHSEAIKDGLGYFTLEDEDGVVLDASNIKFSVDV
jgi:hypothetical protein